MCAPYVAPGTTATASAAAVAAVEAANTATQHALSKRLQSRRNLLALTPSAGGGSGTSDAGSSLATELLEGLYHSLAKDSQAFLKVVCRKNQTVLLHRNKQLIVLGKRDGVAAGDSAAGSSHSAASSPSPSPRQRPPRGHVAHASSARSRSATTTVTGDDNGGDCAADAALCNMVTDVDCGDDHIVAITEQGYLLTWGDGRMGQLGHGLRRSRRTPRLVQSLLHKRIVQVACGARHTFALAEDGDVYSWGYGKGGALGHSTSATAGPERPRKADDDDDGDSIASPSGVADVVASPLEVLTLKHRGVARIACGDMHTAIVLTNGALLTCGWADQGRLGRPCGSASEYSSCFARVDLKHGRLCTFVACGGAHTLVLTDCKSLLAFGSNTSGQLGVGDLRCRAAPTLVAYFDASHATLTGVAAGQRHSFAITQDTRLFAWGSDEFGQCGLGSFPQIYTVPHLVPSTVGLGVVQVAGGDAHSVALCQATPRHLDAMEANHPTRYAALVERFEAFVREDASRRAKVLAVAKQRQLAVEEAARKKKPPLDPTLWRGPAWQAKLEAARAAATEIVETSAPVTLLQSPEMAARTVGRGGARPRTASAVCVSVHSSTSPGKTPRPATSSGGGGRSMANSEKQKVRCSSATLWRQRQLFTFTPPPAATETASRSAISPTKRAARASSARPFKPDTSSVTGTNQAIDSTTHTRPASAAVAHPLRLTPEARQELGRILDGDDEAAHTRGELKTASGVSIKAASDEKQEPHGGASSAVAAAARFPASRPKSAPSRAQAVKCQK
ncbi:hypothetical protein PINS_up024146 [Pythium insidiosum]|nr:hypothetical protein PINS_up024146 [Pythium insidiosum]